MAETRQLRYGIRLPNGTVSTVRDIPKHRIPQWAETFAQDIAALIADAKSEYGVGDDYAPELVHSYEITTTTDWVAGPPQPPSDTE